MTDIREHEHRKYESKAQYIEDNHRRLLDAIRELPLLNDNAVCPKCLCDRITTDCVQVTKPNRVITDKPQRGHPYATTLRTSWAMKRQCGRCGYPWFERPHDVEGN
ncbi:hypothetical protein [Rhodococcus sp. 11-3]|uniref:hypothetical protein n=1 Tax=Rhodococcus sp. 11-3 TaxID=2854796 RepID=UPI00203A655D|nr:hypothetical protein [Rhodococcus sp. 11-3]USC17056.1 hypothetical protein KZJ41_09390 [Rhodococcus sp. 11-3]